MATTEATQAQADTIEAGEDFDDGFWKSVEVRKRDEARAKTAIADPVAAMRKRAERDLAALHEEITDLSADLRVARLEVKAVEACILALGPAPAVAAAPKNAPPAKLAALKAGVRRSGKKHAE